MHDRCLVSTSCLDAAHPSVRAFATEACGTSADTVARAVKLFYAVRDGLRYDPYAIDVSVEGLRASAVLAQGRGWCVAKAGVLVATARAAGIAARLGFADVRNHLATPRLLELMGTDVFYYHGYAELWLDGRWVKATPAFNIELCRKFGVHPLDFDGRTDSIFHPFDAGGRRHMEYLNDRGTRDDMPVEELREALARFYSGAGQWPADADFHAEAEKVGRG